jgi:CO dehydrogenase nickel-insertion accessory protein CooC1
VINIFLIANKIIDESQLDIINDRIKSWEIPLYHSIPFDLEIGKADLNGTSPLDSNPHSKAINSIKALFTKMKQLKLELFDL